MCGRQPHTAPLPNPCALLHSKSLPLPSSTSVPHAALPNNCHTMCACAVSSKKATKHSCKTEGDTVPTCDAAVHVEHQVGCLCQRVLLNLQRVVKVLVPREELSAKQQQQQTTQVSGLTAITAASCATSMRLPRLLPTAIACVKAGVLARCFGRGRGSAVG